jgi:two-component system, NtrC family, sensor histidine kinase HydH
VPTVSTRPSVRTLLGPNDQLHLELVTRRESHPLVDRPLGTAAVKLLDKHLTARAGDRAEPVTTWAAVHLLAAASALVVIALALSRGDRSPLHRPLALLAASQFAWNAACVGYEVTHLRTYTLLGAIASPLFIPLALHFVLTFLGRRQQLRWPLIVTYVVFGAQSLRALVELVVPVSEVHDSVQTFALVLLLTSLPVAVYAIALVTAHLRKAVAELERLRTRILLLALIVVPLLLSTDLLNDLGVPVPRVSTLGTFTFNVMVTWLTLGLGLFTGATRLRVVVGQAVVLGLFFAVSYLAIFTAFNGQLGVLIIALTTLSLVLTVMGWLLVTGSSAAKAGLERFATMGRFSAQMAHDLRTPLAAAKGWGELLIEELRRAGGGPHMEYAQEVIAQLDRLNSVIERYQRISKLEPQFQPIDANALMKRVLSLQAVATQNPVCFEQRLAEPAPVFSGDTDLLQSALENLVKNAVEAMPNGGTLTLSTELTTDRDEPRLVLSVQDTGAGFDARAREQAFELFFTTKATGSGLGLAFVRQVARAHGGDAALTSREGAGTTLSLTLPLTQVTHE